MRINKIHLIAPRSERTMCGIKVESVTTNPDDVTCNKCVGAVELNRAWYENQLSEK